MALAKKMAAQKPHPLGTPLTEDEEQDLKIGVMMAQKMLDEGGLEVVETAISQSKDPAQVIGQFLLQMGQQMMESMPDDMKLSPKILLCKYGWLEQVSDYIREEADVKKDVMDKAEIYVASTAQQMAAAKQSNGQTNGVEAQPPIPSPAAPVAGPGGENV